MAMGNAFNKYSMCFSFSFYMCVVRYDGFTGAIYPSNWGAGPPHKSR